MERQLNFDIQGTDPRVPFLAGMRRLVLTYVGELPEALRRMSGDQG
jgi:hypothetical protein